MVYSNLTVKKNGKDISETLFSVRERKKKKEMIEKMITLSFVYCLLE